MKSQYLLIVLAFFIFSCNSTDVDKNNGLTLEKAIKSVVGTIYFDNYFNEFTVRSSVPGTYDSVDVGIISDLDQSLRRDGLKIRFDGKYYKYNGDVKPSVAGVEYYFLTIKNVVVLD